MKNLNTIMITVIAALCVCGILFAPSCMTSGEKQTANDAKSAIIEADKANAELKAENAKLAQAIKAAEVSAFKFETQLQSAESQHASLSDQLRTAPAAAKPSLMESLGSILRQMDGLAQQRDRASLMKAEYEATATAIAAQVEQNGRAIIEAEAQIDAVAASVQQRANAVTGLVKKAAGYAADAGVPGASIVADEADGLGKMFGGVVGGGAIAWLAGRRKTNTVTEALRAMAAAVKFAPPDAKAAVETELVKHATDADAAVIRNVGAVDNLPA